jgi:hypothetical protein
VHLPPRRNGDVVGTRVAHDHVRRAVSGSGEVDVDARGEGIDPLREVLETRREVGDGARRSRDGAKRRSRLAQCRHLEHSPRATRGARSTAWCCTPSRSCVWPCIAFWACRLCRTS